MEGYIYTEESKHNKYMERASAKLVTECTFVMDNN